MFKHNILCRLYVPFTIFYRIAISVSIAVNIDNLYGTLLPLLICLIFLLYHIINIPYVSTLHNYRSTTIHITELIIVLVANYYRTMLSNTDLNIKSHKHNAAILVYASLMVCILFSVSVAIYEILISIKKCISRKNKKI